MKRVAFCVRKDTATTGPPALSLSNIQDYESCKAKRRPPVKSVAKAAPLKSDLILSPSGKGGAAKPARPSSVDRESHQRGLQPRWVDEGRNNFTGSRLCSTTESRAVTRPASRPTRAAGGQHRNRRGRTCRVIGRKGLTPGLSLRPGLFVCRLRTVGSIPIRSI